MEQARVNDQTNWTFPMSDTENQKSATAKKKNEAKHLVLLHSTISTSRHNVRFGYSLWLVGMYNT